MMSGEDVIHVINRTAVIENVLNQLIAEYCRPRKEAFAFFWTVLLDSSIIPLGAKVKVAAAISQESNDAKLDKDSLHKLISYRNAFAHHAEDAHPTLFVSKNREEDQSHFMLHVITPSGQTREIRRVDALSDFNSCYEKAMKSLVAMLRATKAKTEGEADAVP